MTIISHKFKLIHLHNLKCGGTSFEVALSKYLDANDHFSPEYENYRSKNGYLNAKNYLGDKYYYSFNVSDFKNLIINIRTFLIKLFNYHQKVNNSDSFYYSIFLHRSVLIERHSNIKQISKLFKKESKEYTKICFVRNPIDQFISFYRYRQGRPLKIDGPHINKNYYSSISFDKFTELCAETFFCNVREITNLDSDEDFKITYLKYENYEIRLLKILKKCNVPESFIKTFKNTKLRLSDNILKKPDITKTSKIKILKCAQFLKSFYPELYLKK